MPPRATSPPYNGGPPPLQREIQLGPGSTDPLSVAGTGSLRYNELTFMMEVSLNGAAYTALTTAAAPTLAAVLASGNVSGANPILMTTGQPLDAATPGAVLSVGTASAGALGIGNPAGGASTFQVFVNQGGAALHGSNAGLQFSSTVANRGSSRFNQYGANAGVPGITGFKSRGATVGTLASVADGDILARMTAIGVAGDNASIPLAGFVSIQVPTGGTQATWVATDFTVSLVPLAGPINSNRQVFRVTSEAAHEFIDGTTAPVSPVGKGQIRYNNGTPGFEQSLNGGAWTAFGGSSTLQTAYNTGNTIATTVARPIAFSNAVDATDLLTLTRTFAGAGSAAIVSMGATTTGAGITINMAGGSTGAALSCTGATILVPGTGGATSFQAGHGASAAGFATIAIGNNASTDGNSNNTAVGAASFATIGNSTAIGFVANATGLNSTALGASADALFDNTVCVGAGTTVGATGCIAVGQNASCGATADAIAIGRNATAPGIAIGVAANCTTATSMVVGQNASCTDATSVVVGNNASVSAASCVVVGQGSSANQIQCTVVGQGVTATAVGVIAIGQGSGASDTAAIAIGQTATATVANGIAIGSAATAQGISIGASSSTGDPSNIAIGFGSTTSAFPDAIAIGNGSSVIGNFGTTLGTNSAAAVQGVVVGRDAFADVTAGATIVIGYNAFAGFGAGNSTVIGWQANSQGSDSTTVGHNTTCNGGVVVGSGASDTAGGIAIGPTCTISQLTGIAIGNAAAVSGTHSIAIGFGAGDNGGSDCTIMGFGAFTLVAGSSSVVLGSGANSGFASSIAIGMGAATTFANQAVLGSAAHPITTISFGNGADVGISRLAAASFALGNGTSGDFTASLKLTGINNFGNHTLAVAGNEFLIKEGANASMGLATLVGGAVVVPTTLVTANSRIFLAIETPIGVPGFLWIGGRIPGASFQIQSSSVADNSLVAWLIVEPA